MKRSIAALAALVCAAVLHSQEAAVPPAWSLRLDPQPATISLDAGGFGFGLGFEGWLGAGFSANAEFRQVSMPDASTWFVIAWLGARWRPWNGGVEGFYLGLAGLALYGDRSLGPELEFGLLAEAGYSWNVAASGWIVEPYVKYPFFFSENPMFGIMPGIAVGFAW